MHNMGVTLHDHQIRNLNRSDFRHPSEVVAPQIDQHQVFGSFFLIGKKFVGQRAVLLLDFTSGPGTGDGAQGGDTAFQTYHDFRR